LLQSGFVSQTTDMTDQKKSPDDNLAQEVHGVPEAQSGLAPKPAARFYLLPNAFTTAGLFCGFYAVVQAMNGQFANAATAIFVAMLMDSLDGRIARMTNTQSAFGEQYDSLADMVSFGAAPAWFGSLGLAGRFCLLRRSRVTLGSFQHEYRRGRQALLSGVAQSGCGRLSRWPGLDHDRLARIEADYFNRQGFGVALFWSNPLCRGHDGVERALL
jgi:hypothetical protein